MGISDIRPKTVKVMLDKERHLQFDLNAFALLEEKYGSVEEALNTLETGSIKAIREVLWAGLVHEELDEKFEPKISPIQVGSWIGISGLEALTEKIKEALDQAKPVEAEGDTPSPQS